MFRTINMTLKMSQIKTFVFLDLETTGMPHLDHNTTRITEFSAVAIQTDHLELGCFPRVHNKLSICLNPNKMILPETTEITGLSNELLEHQTSFTSQVVETINSWLNLNQRPICFVAHNGNRFDFPILRKEIFKTDNSLPDDILCVDSLQIFRALDKPPEEPTSPLFDDGLNESLSKLADQVEIEERCKLTPQEINQRTPEKQKIRRVGVRKSTPTRQSNRKSEFVSYKLGNLFKRLTGKEVVNAHEADSDVTMLITCAAVYGESFVKYANEHAKQLNDVPMMKPGRIVGT